jgi:hypothetical protein
VSEQEQGRSEQQLRAALDGVTAQRRAYDQLLDEKGVLEERVRTLQRKEAQYLETLQHQSVLLIELDELLHNKDLVRCVEIRKILDQLWEHTR